MNKAIFLDRDGTINVDYGYVFEKEKLHFIDGVIKALKAFRSMGYKLIIITNQSGIARGYYTEEQMNEFNNYMCNILKKNGVIIDKIYYCPHCEDNCNCRKPKTELFYKAKQDFDIDFSKSFAIGDKERDLSICKKEAIKGILFGESNNSNYQCFKNYDDIVKYIEENI